MIALLLSGAGFVALALAADFLHRHFHLRASLTRKIAHMSAGAFSFFLLDYLDRDQLIILSIGAALFLLLAKQWNFFPGIHGVSRRTLGEIYFPLSIGLLASFFLPLHLDAVKFAV